MKKSFSAAFNEHLARTGRKIPDIADASGVNADALYKLKYGKTRNMAVDDAIRVASAFGETIEEFMDSEPTRVKTELARHLDLLTDSEREILLASITALVARRQRDESQLAGGAEEAAADRAQTTKK